MFGKGMETFHKDSEAFKLFFNAVGLWLNREIDLINVNSGEASITGTTKRALVGKTGLRKLIAEPTFELVNESGRTGFVRLSLIEFVIEAEIDDPESIAVDEKRNIRFRLENCETGAKAFKIETIEGLPQETEFGPQELAKNVVAGVVRGYFV
jgi:hypothetical protein